MIRRPVTFPRPAPLLRDLGADYRPIRRAVSAALAGYTVITASKQAREQAASQVAASAAAGPASQFGPSGGGLARRTGTISRDHGNG